MVSWIIAYIYFPYIFLIKMILCRRVSIKNCATIIAPLNLFVSVFTESFWTSSFTNNCIECIARLINLIVLAYVLNSLHHISRIVTTDNSIHFILNLSISYYRFLIIRNIFQSIRFRYLSRSRNSIL